MEIVSIIIALFSLIVSIFAIIISNAASKESNKLSSTANDLAKGQVEMQIREMISSARTRYTDLVLQLEKDKSNKTLVASTEAALEDVLNTYDEACAKYNDKKVDTERFKKLYVTEIRNLVDDNITKNYYVMPQSKFKATVKVYDEWNNLE